MGFIDTINQPESDLYRYADPGVAARRLAAEDVATGAQRVVARRRETQPVPPEMPQAPEMPHTLTRQEWVTQNHPEIARMPMVPKEMLRSIHAGYKEYLNVRVQEINARLGTFHAQMRGAELAERRAGRKEGYAESRLGRRETFAHQNRTRRAKAAEPQRPGTIPGNIAAQTGYAHLTGVDAGKISALEQILGRVYPQAGGGGTAAGTPAGKDLLPGGAMYSTVFGSDPIQSLTARLADSPVAGWLELNQYVGSATGFLGQQGGDALAAIVEQYKPTPQQVAEAQETGEITEEQAAEILKMILTPEQLAHYQNVARTDAPNKKPGFWEGVGGAAKGGMFGGSPNIRE